MTEVSEKISQLKELKRYLALKYDDEVSVHLSYTAFDREEAVGACLLVSYKWNSFKIKLVGDGSVIYSYNYLNNPIRFVSISGVSVVEFCKKLKYELHRRYKKLH